MIRCKSYFAAIVMLLLQSLSSCSILDGFGVDSESEYECYEDVVVATSLLPLYADLGPSSTKSHLSDSDSSDLVSLESLIDRTKVVTKTFEQYSFMEVPFKSNENPSYAVLRSNADMSISEDDLSEIYLFLVETTDTILNIVERRVVTMIPDKNYLRNHSGEPRSYINKGVFSGIVLYSEIDGHFRDVYVYGGDFCPIMDGTIIDEADKEDYSGYCFLSLVGGCQTKGGDDSETSVLLPPSYCIAEDGDHSECNHPDFWYDEGADGDLDNGSDSGTGSGPGGGGYSPGNGGSPSGSSPDEGDIDNSDNPDPEGDAEGDEEDLPEEKQKYNVSLYASDGGRVLGTGQFLEGALVFGRAIPFSSYRFDRWVGDFNGNSETFSMRIERDISATAYFRLLLDVTPVRPCYDADRKMYNPLVEMTVAPTSRGATNYIGSTYGWTRDGGTKFHNGLDLYAPEGTPVYAMYDGVISSKHRYVVEQPNRNTKAWPSGYSGDTDGAGNRFAVESKIDDKTVCFLYWHMQAGTPVALNPRTGDVFKPGDVVYAGEVIGYTGRTGNAYNVHFYHLHLVVKDDNGVLNPEAYINGDLQWADGSKAVLSETGIVNIKCDDEFNDMEF